MTYTFTGDNRYLIDSELIKLKKQLGFNNDDLSVTVINGPEIQLQDLKMELTSYTLFSSQRLVILSEPSKIKGFDDYIEQASSSIPESTALVIIEPSIDKRKSYYKYLKANTEFRQLDKISGALLVKWVQDYAKDIGGNISSNEANYLIDRTSDDQLILSQEIAKLVLYSADINRQTIDLLTEQSASSTIFELLDAAFNESAKKALGIYNDQRLQKVEPEQILAMLSWQLNVVAIYMTSKNLPQNQVLSMSKLSPYTFSKAKQIATRLSFSSLKQLVSELSNLDLRNKATSFDLDEGLKNFIISLSI